MQKTEKLPSIYIQEFTRFVTDAIDKMEFLKEELAKQERVTQDYLHKLELEKLPYNEKAKIATRLAEARRDRRYYKDKIEELTPIVDFFEDSNNKTFLNKLKIVLGDCRKAERYHEHRTYTPKAIK